MVLNRCSVVALLATALLALHSLPAQGQTRPATRQAPRTAPASALREQAPSGSAQPRGSSSKPAADIGPIRGAQVKPGANKNPPPGPRQASATPRQNLTPPAPFELTATQQDLLEKILLKWEKQSDKVTTFSCRFTRWEYDPTWGPKENNYEKSRGSGHIKFRAPDQGEYQIDMLEEYDAAQRKYVKKDGSTNVLDHWTCDGKSIFEYNTTKKQLIERKLPPEMQGKAIADGPLPFIFGAKADQLKRRYWMRDITPSEKVGKEVWLEAFPKFQQDAANFQRATIILTEADFLPSALEIVLPALSYQGAKGANQLVANTAYTFGGNSVNSIRDSKVFELMRPKLTPAQIAIGWRHVVDNPNAPAEAPAEKPAAETTIPQAKRPTTSPRK